jgi:hypothetical protein
VITSVTRWRRLVVALLGLAVLLAACASNDAVRDVSLATLASSQERFDGTIVRTHGRLRAFADPDGKRYVVAEDARDDRVRVEPQRAAQRFVGSEATLVGCFTASTTSDRTLRVSTIVRADAEQPHRLRIRSPGPCRPAGRQEAA